MSDPKSIQMISIVVPCYREEQGLLGLHAAITGSLAEAQVEWELILVDDGSPDDTWGVIRRLCASHLNVKGRRFSRNFGKDAALLAGIEMARGDAVITMDADQQHPPAILPSMLEAWNQGADVVGCVKVSRMGQSFLMRSASRAFNRLFRGLTGLDLRESTDFKLLSRRALSALGGVHERNFFFRGAVAWTGLESRTVEFPVEARSAGESKFRTWSLVKLALLGITSFSSKPLHLVTIAGFAFGVASVVLAIQTLVGFFTGRAAAGFTTVILLLLIIGTLVLVGMGIIGEYVGRIYEEVRSRPRYIVAEEA